MLCRFGATNFVTEILQLSSLFCDFEPTASGMLVLLSMQKLLFVFLWHLLVTFLCQNRKLAGTATVPSRAELPRTMESGRQWNSGTNISILSLWYRLVDFALKVSTCLIQRMIDLMMLLWMKCEMDQTDLIFTASHNHEIGEVTQESWRPGNFSCTCCKTECFWTVNGIVWNSLLWPCWQNIFPQTSRASQHCRQHFADLPFHVTVVLSDGAVIVNSLFDSRNRSFFLWAPWGDFPTACLRFSHPQRAVNSYRVGHSSWNFWREPKWYLLLFIQKHQKLHQRKKR